jgi:DNA-binding MarR family transcriptional regulator
VNISSIKKESNYPTPEFRKIIESLERIKKDVKQLKNITNDPTSYKKLIKNISSLEEAIHQHYRELNSIEQLFFLATTAKLTKKQRMILRWLVEHYNQKTVYTVLIQEISKELEIPRSTVRWNLRGLREAELIQAGDKDNKGIPVSLTPIGKIMADYAITIND